MGEIFASADIDRGGFLDVEEFIDAFEGILSTSDGADAAALRKLFARVDVNADGVIDWNEFVSYMLLDQRSSMQSSEVETVPKLSPNPITPAIPEKQTHRALMTSLCKIPPGIGDFYVSTGRDGNFVVWNATDLEHEKTITAANCWISAGAFMPLAKKFCIADFSRAVKIYDCPSFQLVGSVQDLPYAPLCLATWKNAKRRDVDFLCLGDIAGNVFIYEVKCVVSDKRNPDRFNHKLRWSRKLHTDMVTSVKHVAELNSIISTSADTSVAITDIEHRMSVKRLLGHSKSVNACDWSSFYKFVCSGGQDRAVILWNPFSKKPLASLLGHTAPITALRVYDRGNQLISLSTDKCIKVWDIRNHGCLQSLFDKESYHPYNTLGALLFDEETSRLVCGNKKLKAWDMERSHTSNDLVHEGAVIGLMYNCTFDEVVSGDDHGNICAWSASTGKLRSRFARIAGNQTVTSVAFDENERKLLTATENGTCYMWNASNGSPLRTFTSKTGLEICAIVCRKMNGKNRVVTAGWDKALTLFDDDLVKKEILPVASYSGHEADITSLAAASHANLMASGDYDGKIVIWNTESWAVRKKLFSGDQSPIINLCFTSAEQKYLLAALAKDGKLRIWNAFKGSVVSEICIQQMPTSMAMHPATNAIVIGTTLGQVQVFDLVAGTGGPLWEKMNEWSVSHQAVSNVAWIPEKRQILVATVELHISIWSITGSSVQTLRQGNS